MDRYLNRKAFVTTLGAAGLGLGMTAAAPGGAPAVQAQDVSSSGPAEDIKEGFLSDEMRAEFYAAFTAALGEELGIFDAAAVDTGIRAALATVVDGLASDDLVTPGQATAVKSLIETIEVPLSPGPLAGHRQATVMRAIGPEDSPGFPGARIAAIRSEATAEGPSAIAQRFYPDFTAALADTLGAGSADDVDGAIRLAMMTVIDGIDSDALPMPIPTDALKAMVATAESPLGPGLLFGAHPGMTFRAFHGRESDGPAFHGRGGDDGWFGDRDERARAGDGDERGARGDEDATDDDSAAGEETEDDASE